MPDRFSIRTSRTLSAALCLAATAVAGCAVSLPPAPQNNPANPNAPQAATAPLHPRLVATSRTFLSPRADDREQEAKQMDMKKMNGMQHDMNGMHGLSHGFSASPASATSSYTCPMHPEIQETKPGECPKCGMTLIKKSKAPERTKP